MSFRFYTWEEFDVDTEKIARVVSARVEIKGVYGPPRGGLPLAVKLSHRLGIQLLLLPPIPVTGLFEKNELLIVDDIADTGKTLTEYHERGFFVATLFKHPKCPFEPNVWIREKDDRWIIFPWENREKEMARATKIMNPDK